MTGLGFVRNLWPRGWSEAKLTPRFELIALKERINRVSRDLEASRRSMLLVLGFHTEHDTSHCYLCGGWLKAFVVRIPRQEEGWNAIPPYLKLCQPKTLTGNRRPKVRDHVNHRSHPIKNER